MEASLNWAIQKVRRAGGGRAGGFPGADIILTQLTNGTLRKRIGLIPEGRAPMREGVVLFASEMATDPIGKITSGGFGPTVGGPVAMGYLTSDFAVEDSIIFGKLRGKRQPLKVEKLPFTPANFKR